MNELLEKTSASAEETITTTAKTTAKTTSASAEEIIATTTKTAFETTLRCFADFRSGSLLITDVCTLVTFTGAHLVYFECFRCNSTHELHTFIFSLSRTAVTYESLTLQWLRRITTR